MYEPKGISYRGNETILKKLLFRVDLKNVYYEDLNSVNNVKFIPNYKALVNLENNELLSVVTNNYHLISNEQALNMGKEAVKKLFGESDFSSEDLVIFSIWHNKKLTACSIDLIYKTVDFKDFKQATWLPFVRIVNSYNKQYKLQYVIGFVRSICTNKVIFEGKTITLSYAHSKGFVPNDILVSQVEFVKQKSEFLVYLENFNKYNVKSEFVIRHVYKALGFKSSDIRDINLKNSFEDKIEGMWDYYSKDDNNTAYALFNVVTDMVSNCNLGKLTGIVRLESEINNGVRVGNWVKLYADALGQRNYNEANFVL